MAIAHWCTGASIFALVGCSSAGELHTQQDQEATRLQTDLRSQRVLPTVTIPTPRVASMELQLLSKSTARLGLRLTAASNQELARAGRFTLTSHNDTGATYTFNDQGRDSDTAARDGVWSSTVPINVEFLEKLNSEAQRLRLTSIERYDYASGASTGSVRVPRTLLDITALKRGRNIPLYPLTAAGVLTTSGAAFTGPVVAENSLLINATSVVENPERTRNPCAASLPGEASKPWTFGRVMEQLAAAAGVEVHAFTEQWLDKFRFAQDVRDTSGNVTLDATSDLAASNLEALVVGRWRARSGGGALDLNLAPFRLLAITYRPDLAEGYYGIVEQERKGAGEVHLVFGLLNVVDANGDGDALDTGDTCAAADMTLNFRVQPRDHELRWHQSVRQSVGATVTAFLGASDYNTLLQTLTDGVVNTTPEATPATAFMRLRTNEAVLSGVFQLREFGLRVTPSGGALQWAQVTLRNNPRQHQTASTAVPILTLPRFRSTAQIFVALGCEGPPRHDQLHGLRISRVRPSGSRSRAAVPTMTQTPYWDHVALATDQEKQGRFRTSLGSCTGCHSRETATAFFHVRSRRSRDRRGTFPFLFNSPYVVTDPRGINRPFNEKRSPQTSL